MDYTDQMAKYGFIAADHISPKRFPVEVEDCFTKTGEKVPGYKAILRPDTRQILHVATSAYALVTHEKTETAFELALHESKLPTEGMLVNRDDSHQGCRAFVCYVLPKVTHNVNGAEIALTLGWGNSYDGSMAFHCYGGHLNFNCNNLARNGEMIHSRKHVGEIDVDAIAIDLIRAAEKYHTQLIAMQRWPQIEIDDNQAIEIYEALPGSNKRLQAELLPHWLRAKHDTGPNGGANLWALYNTLTYWSTHGDGFKEATKAYAKANREERVAELVESEHWQALTA